MSSIQTVSQSLAPDEIVSLFTFDTTSIGGPILPFVEGRVLNEAVYYGGTKYEAIDIEFDGLETSGAGAFPQPEVKIANTDGIIQSIMNAYGEPLGCTLFRIRTYGRFLDNGATPDSQAFYGPDVFRVERRVSENPVYLHFELSAAIDQEGKQLPGRQVIRDTCLWRYRAFNQGTGDFDYSKAQCPYAGDKYFDINDQEVTDPAKDQCSRRISGCEARFGEGKPLPFGGFPGVARVRA